MHAHRIDVLDRADDHAVVGAVAHHLQLVLLPTGDALLDEDLADRAGRKSFDSAGLELCSRRGDPRSAAAEDVGGTDDDGQTDALDDRHRLFEVVSYAADGHGKADLDHRLLELVAIFGSGDGLGVGADHLRCAGHTDDAAFEQGHGRVETGLSTERRQDRIGPLALDDLGDDLRRDRLDVGGISEVGVGHDRRRIGVDEDDPVALFTQHATGLRARVVELAGLADHDRTGTDDQDRVDVSSLRHQTPASIRSANISKRYRESCGPGPASGWYCTLKAGIRSTRMPSLVSSLRLRWVTSTLPSRLAGSTQKL